MTSVQQMIPVPDLSPIDIVFGAIKHLPKYDDVPEAFKNWNRPTPYNEFVSEWFFKGLSIDDIGRLIPKSGVDKKKALLAIKAILSSFEPKHEHKEAGAAYLLSQWFDIAPAKEGNAA